MKRRYAQQEVSIFSLSFVDAIAAALGGVITLVFILAVLERKLANEVATKSFQLVISFHSDSLYDWAPRFFVAHGTPGESVQLTPVAHGTGGSFAGHLSGGPTQVLRRVQVFSNTTPGSYTVQVEGGEPGAWWIVAAAEAQQGVAGVARVEVQILVAGQPLFDEPLGAAVELKPGHQRLLSYERDFEGPAQVGDAFPITLVEPEP
jgi:hypothetical protein